MHCGGFDTLLLGSHARVNGEWSAFSPEVLESDMQQPSNGRTAVVHPRVYSGVL